MKQINKSPATGNNYSGSYDLTQEGYGDPMYWLRKFNIFANEAALPLIFENWSAIFRIFIIAKPILEAWTKEQDKYKQSSESNPKNAGRPRFDIKVIFACFIIKTVMGDSLNSFAKKISYDPIYKSCLYAFLGFVCEIPKLATLHKYFDILNNDEVLAQVCKLHTSDSLELARMSISQEHVAREVGKTAIIDSSYMDVDITKRTAEEHKAIKDGTYVPTYGGTDSYLSESQKDDSATFSKKRNQSHYGYKYHALADAVTKLIFNFTLTPGHVHDSQKTLDLCDSSTVKFEELYADSGYAGKKYVKVLNERGIYFYVTLRAYRGHPLTKEKRAINKATSSIRSRIEHAFHYLDNVLMFKLRAKTMERHNGYCQLFTMVYNALQMEQILSGNYTVPNYLKPVAM